MTGGLGSARFREAAASQVFQAPGTPDLPGPGVLPANPGAPLQRPPPLREIRSAGRPLAGAPLPRPRFLLKQKQVKQAARPARPCHLGDPGAAAQVRSLLRPSPQGPLRALPAAPKATRPQEHEPLADRIPDARPPNTTDSRHPAWVPAAPRDPDLGATHVPRPVPGFPGRGSDAGERSPPDPGRPPGPTPLLPRLFGQGRRRFGARAPPCAPARARARPRARGGGCLGGRDGRRTAGGRLLAGGLRALGSGATPHSAQPLEEVTGWSPPPRALQERGEKGGQEGGETAARRGGGAEGEGKGGRGVEERLQRAGGGEGRGGQRGGGGGEEQGAEPDLSGGTSLGA